MLGSRPLAAAAAARCTLENAMATKLDTFLAEQKIDPRRIVAASRQLERLRPEDRAIKLKHLQARKKEDGKKPEGLGKPRSGRALAEVTVRNAVTGGRISGPTKTRILRAVNLILEQRKNEPVALEALFEPKAVEPKKAAEAESE